MAFALILMKIDSIFDEGSSKEDTYLIGKNIFGVFDGANSINRFFDDGKPGGLIAAMIARDSTSVASSVVNLPARGLV